MDVEKAKEVLNNLGFKVYIDEKQSEKPQGTVIEQSLQKGHKIDPDETDRTITLTVSKGLEIEIPNVVGMEINAAKSRLESKDFKVVLSKLSTDSLSDEEIERIEINRVMKQSPESFGTVNKKDETITLYYYDSKPDNSMND